MINSDSDVGNFLGKDGVTKDCWKRLADHLQATFDLPPDTDSSRHQYKDDGELPPEVDHPEPEVDEMRAQRDMLLVRYIQEAERREAMQARMDQGGGEAASEASDNSELQEEEAKSSKSSSGVSTSKKTKK